VRGDCESPSLGECRSASRDQGKYGCYGENDAARSAGICENHGVSRRSTRGPLTLEGFANSGADWLDRFKPYIEDGKTIVVSPHKVWGPQTNDLVLQLRKRGIGKIILGGMLANICVESHLREFLEQGFEVAIVKDATAGPRHPVWGDGYQAAMINYQFLAHAVLSTDEAVDRMR
jgi:nicotinamidase-related amidase